MGGNEGLWAGVNCRVNVWSSVEVKCWTLAGHWTERKRERDRCSLHEHVCLYTLPYVERERQHGLFDNDGFSLHRHKIVRFVTIK